MAPRKDNGTEAGDAKARLLAAARREFLKKGFAGASLREIARQAGLTTGPLYWHFRDKEDLFGALVAPAWDALFAEPFSAADADRAAAAAPNAEAREAEVSSLFPAGPLRERALAAVRAKLLPPGELRERLARLASLWEPLREKLDAELMHPQRMRAMLEAAGCPVSPADFGLSPARAGAAALAAPMLSERYAVFDLALETGRLPACAAAAAGA